MLEGRRVVLVDFGQRDPGLDAEEARRPPAASGVRSEWVTPRPAIIQLSAPGSMIWSAPVLSR
jgi:hypothetical protein